jgi:hypothetical protein
MDRNRWPDCVGMGGRFGSESVAGLRRNMHPLWTGDERFYNSVKEACPQVNWIGNYDISPPDSP